MVEYEIKLAAFEGPLDLLMHLIDKNKIDIYDIPIAEITEQYMAYLNQSREFAIEIATEFLVMAATLLYIKSRLLLPKPPQPQEEETADPRQELVERLLEYRRYKEISLTLEDMAEKQAQLFYRQPSLPQQMIKPPRGLDINELLRAFEDVLTAKIQEDTLVSREQYSVPDKMEKLLVLLENRPAGILFAEAFRPAARRLEIITTFMAVLELVKLGRLSAEQSAAFAPIYLKLADMDGESANANF